MRGTQKKLDREFLYERIVDSLQKPDLVRAGDRVGVAVSGGADSVALLLLLFELRERMGIVLCVVHFNHQLRGKRSDADEKFVGKLAKRLAIPLFRASADIAARAKQEKANLEDMGRRGRYEFFQQLARDGRLNHVVTAHTADDQAETVLAHILRGTGLAGLGGIHLAAGCVLRPMLGVRRNELREYLRERKQSWREDATNQDVTRTRARIRKKLIPLLEKQFQGEVVAHLAQLAELARADEGLLDELSAERLAVAAQERNGQKKIPVSELSPPNGRFYFSAIISRMIRKLIAEVKTGEGQISARHVDAVLELARNGESGKFILLPGGVEVRRQREELVFLGNPQEKSTVGSDSEARGGSGGRANRSTRRVPLSYEYKIVMASGMQLLRVPELGCAFRLREIDWTAKRGETSYLGAVLDRDRLTFPLVLRNWRPGDRFCPAGHASAHKMKRLLNEKRLSRWERDGWPVVTSGGVLVWVRGFPPSGAFAANDTTQTGIVIAEEKYK